jgi:hypothetical protein
MFQGQQLPVCGNPRAFYFARQVQFDIAIQFDLFGPKSLAISLCLLSPNLFSRHIETITDPRML